MNNPTLRTNVIPPNALRILQCDQHTSASWVGEDGVAWSSFYLRWRPADNFYGRAKEALSKFHNPVDCLPASGLKLESRPDPATLTVRPGFNLVFDRYVFDASGQPLFVFFSQTEDMVGDNAPNFRMTHWGRLRAALEGSRNYGQVNLEVALAGPASPDEALRIFRAQLPKLITTTTSAQP